MVVLNLIKGPVAHLLAKRQQTVHGGQAWGSPSVGYFPSASRKCFVEKMLLEMVVGKRRGESAVKINFCFVNTHALQRSASTQVQILVLLVPAGCCAALLARMLLGGWPKRSCVAARWASYVSTLCLQPRLPVPLKLDVDIVHSCKRDSLIPPVRAVQAMLTSVESLPFGMELISQLCLSFPSTSSFPKDRVDKHLCFGVNFLCLCCLAHAGWPLFTDAF